MNRAGQVYVHISNLIFSVIVLQILINLMIHKYLTFINMKSLNMGGCGYLKQSKKAIQKAIQKHNPRNNKMKKKYFCDLFSASIHIVNVKNETKHFVVYEKTPDNFVKEKKSNDYRVIVDSLEDAISALKERYSDMKADLIITLKCKK